MKQFIMLLHGPASYELTGMSPEEIQERMGQWFAWTDKLKERGAMLGGEALHASAKLISGPNKVVSDRSASDLKEVVGGFYHVQANSIEEVLEMAEDFPDFDINGAVEIREVVNFEEYS